MNRAFCLPFSRARARESLYAKWNGLWNVHYWLFVIDEATEISEADVRWFGICVCIGIAVLRVRYFTFVVSKCSDENWSLRVYSLHFKIV